ncbi:hypothetical protein [Bradyrhizobium sp. PRIMUS42]|uniref:hypothetical protein n=1 Tax=Bradyrhizobium sp. PRIMUS42 TaxID=2908926 RepID=UPI001FF1C3FF|nr:hypothetical protein [Bradyrhizobium sp. PRIMUS42]MCJ9729059.1 hypothetical protein [Bradyrhizobium sp. PRIMUS42]
MASVNPIFESLSVDPGQVIAVTLACRTLQHIGQLEVDREIIARRIVQAADDGERDVGKLCERAIHGLTALDYRQHST